MANTKLANVKINEISLKSAQELVNSVKDGLALVSKGYLTITPDVAKLYDGKAFKSLGYKNFDEMCAMEFGMSHGTTVGIRKVFDKFGTITKGNEYVIPEKYLEYGYTKLLLFTDKKFETAGIDPIETFSPDMTMSEMKSILSEKLEDKIKKQEEEAIDTTAEEVNEAVNEDATTDNNTLDDVIMATDSDMLNEIISIAEELKERMNYIGGEKSALLDAIIADAKDLKKIAKKN